MVHDSFQYWNRQVTMDNTMRGAANIAILDVLIVQWATQCMVLKPLQSWQEKGLFEQHNV